MKRITALIFLSCISPILFGQVTFESKDILVSPAAFNKKITTQFNYLIFGDNSPQQGFSATLNDKKSNIKINGLLYAGNAGVFSVEADLAASNGIYFFDQENGSEQGKITLNYYNRLWSSSSYKSLSARNRAFINLQILELITNAKQKYEGLSELLKSVKFDNEPALDSTFNDRIYKTLRTVARKYINEDQNLGFNQLEEKPFDKSAYIVVKVEDSLSAKGVRDVKVDNINNYNLLKLLKDYDTTGEFIMNKLEDSINKVELQKTEKQWTWNKTLFLGFSPFYERQSFKRFTYDATQSFSDMFARERGDIYGATFSLNLAIDKGAGNKSRFKPQAVFTRLSLTLNRASNISSFKNSTLETSNNFGNDSNGNPVVFTNTDNAFIGDAIYEFGFGTRLTWDSYIYPFNAPIGVFGSIGYENISFNSGSPIKDKELYPMRLGLLFSLTNKESKKPNVTVQAFIDRSNLKLSLNGEDKDLRFGLGIGLPINF